jgi:hypothetical protein
MPHNPARFCHAIRAALMLLAVLATQQAQPQRRLADSVLRKSTRPYLARMAHCPEAAFSVQVRAESVL